jgi:hypothetical protein
MNHSGTETQRRDRQRRKEVSKEARKAGEEKIDRSLFLVSSLP